MGDVAPQERMMRIIKTRYKRGVCPSISFNYEVRNAWKKEIAENSSKSIVIGRISVGNTFGMRTKLGDSPKEEIISPKGAREN